MKRTLAQAALLAVAALALSVAAAAQTTKPKPPPEPLDLNRATLEELQQLPEVGPATARSIVRFRERNGGFRRVEELLAIRGISRRRFERIRPHVFVKADTAPAQSRASGNDGPA
jgi:competence ComEA-like helix-hairpin-helix protein